MGKTFCIIIVLIFTESYFENEGVQSLKSKYEMNIFISLHLKAPYPR